MKTGYFIKQFAGTLFFFSIIFLSAGTINYYQAWTYVAIGTIMFIFGNTLLSPDSALISERSKPGEGTKKWDRIILLVSLLLTISMYVVAGLDSGRHHWSPEFGPVLFAAGLVLTAAGQLLFLIAQKQNRFFSSTVRIQTDRGHEVCDHGLYSFVRHPAYMGSVIQALGFPLLLGSLFSIIPVSLLVASQVVRTFMEDNTLKNELKGYAEYAEKTKYRLIPLIW